MDNCVITFRSVTPAQRGEGILRKAGYGCSIRRTPRWMENQGCGYSLRVRCDQVLECVRLLRESRISFRKVYLQREGSMEEMAL